jgi:hypothetical protein
VSLPDRIDPRPPRRIYRWDLDKTYLQTEFDSLRDLLRTAFQKAHEKTAVPGASALIRELAANGDTRLCIVSGSPKQLRSVLEEKLKLDGVKWDEFVLKDNVGNLLRGRFRALRGQVGYKLPALLESRAKAPVEAEEVLFGDDAEADAFIYSLFADMVAGRVDERVLKQILETANLYPDETEKVLAAWKKIPVSDPVRRIFIHLDRLTPPAHFADYGPRVVPIFNYFQAALVLLADGHLTAAQCPHPGAAAGAGHHLGVHQAARRAGHAASAASGAGGGLPGAHPPRAPAHPQGAQDAVGPGCRPERRDGNEGHRHGCHGHRRLAAVRVPPAPGCRGGVLGQEQRPGG